MRTIYRYPLRVTDVQTITGPGLDQIVSVDNRRSELEVWGEVNTAEIDVTWKVYVVGTGNSADHVVWADHVGHVIDGPFVWHVYARRDEA